MQSKIGSLAWMFWSDPAKHFDTSGKSPALFHHHAICKTPMVLLCGGTAQRHKPGTDVKTASETLETQSQQLGHQVTDFLGKIRAA